MPWDFETVILNNDVSAAKPETVNGKEILKENKNFESLEQDCSNSIANALELLQSSAKSLICYQHCVFWWSSTIR